MGKSYVFSVSLSVGCYRHIQISKKATLFQLHQAIINAYDFDDDHAHVFFMSNHWWDQYTAYVFPVFEQGDRSTQKFKLETFKFQKGDQFKYIFDYGAEWRFQCKFLREVDVPTDIPGVIRSKGEAPPQYEDLDEDELDEFWDEDMDDDIEDFPEIYESERLEEMRRALRISPQVQDVLNVYCEAAVRLYGIIPLWKLLEIYNKQNKTIAQEDFLDFMEILRHQENFDFAILGRETFDPGALRSLPIERELVADHLFALGFEDYYELQELQEGKPWCVLPREEFLRYADDEYYPDIPERRAMLKFAKKKEKDMPHCTAEELVMEIQDMIELGMPIQMIVDDVIRLCDENFSKQDFEEFAELYFPLHNNCRMIANRGYTPRELSSMHKAEKPQDVMKRMMQLPDPSFGPLSVLPGTTEWNPPFVPAKQPEPSRNGPCPCGSGKKYKRCCGKDKK